MAKHDSVARAPHQADELTRDVLAGLRKPLKEVSSQWFYDEHGSTLFDEICELPEYYLTRTELGIMQRHAPEMAQALGPRVALIEFGSGTSLKTRLLLDHLEELAAYVPVDIAEEHLLDAAGDIARHYPALRVMPIRADFTRPFDLPAPIAFAQRRVVYFPGSTLGNFEPTEAERLLSTMRNIVGVRGAVLIGIDLRKDPRVLEQAYDDAAGVTADFNRNALRHINREVGADFDPDAFEHLALWVENQSRIEMHLVSTRDQVVRVAGERVPFRRGEHLRTEYCHKYTFDSFAALAARADLSVARAWADPEWKFSVQLLQAATQT